MSNLKVFKFRLVIVSIVLLSIFISLYAAVISMRFNIEHLNNESVVISKYAKRALSRINANPSWYIGAQPNPEKSIGTLQLNVAFDLNSLKERFPDIGFGRLTPDKLDARDSGQHQKVLVFLKDFRGFFELNSFILVKPIYSEHALHYAYLISDLEGQPNALSLSLMASLVPISILALTIILVIFIFELSQLGRVENTLNKFHEWSNTFHVRNSASPPPEFNEGKFNYLAHTLTQSLSNISDAMDKELSFAKYTSHELRGSIAALSANMEVLELIMRDLSPRERSVLKNMENVIADIRYQMEALLWISKESNEQVQVEECSAREIIDKAISDNTYLAKDRDIQIIVGEGDLKFKTHPILIQIITNNIVRNAVQHTHAGQVRAEFLERAFSVTNINMDKHNTPSSESSFGIGLVLVEKLAEKLDINIEYNDLPNGREVKISV